MDFSSRQYSNFLIPTKYWLGLFARRKCWRRDEMNKSFLADDVVILISSERHVTVDPWSGGLTGSHLPSTSRHVRAKINLSEDNGSSITNIWPTRETRLLLAERLSEFRYIMHWGIRLNSRLMKSIETFYSLIHRTFLAFLQFLSLIAIIITADCKYELYWK